MHLRNVVVWISASAGGLLVLLLSAVRPVLLLAIAAGALAGALVALTYLAWRQRYRIGSWTNRNSMRIALASLAVSVVGIVGLLSLTTAIINAIDRSLAVVRGVEGPVRGVRYDGAIRHVQRAAGDSWRVVEHVRLRESLLKEETRKSALDGQSLGQIRPRLLPGWRYIGRRGPAGALRSYLYERRRSLAIELGERVSVYKARMPLIASQYLKSRLVPAAGSEVTFNAPPRLILATRPSPRTREEFRGREIVTVALHGLEDDRAQRLVALELTNGIARWALYQKLRRLSFLDGILALVAAASGVILTFALNRALSRRFPDPLPAKP